MPRRSCGSGPMRILRVLLLLLLQLISTQLLGATFSPQNLPLLYVFRVRRACSAASRLSRSSSLLRSRCSRLA